MNLTLKKSLALSIAALLSYNLLATTPDYQEYELLAYNDCDVVYRAALTEEQKSAYDELNKQSEMMKKLEQPIQSIQPSLDKLSEEMKALSKIAVQETEEVIRIDKEAMAKQNEVAAKIDVIIKDNDTNFKAIEAQGKRIEKAAKVFESLLEGDLTLKNYDYIQIVTDKKTRQKCHDAISAT